VNVKLPPARRAIGMAMFGLTATLGPLLDRRSRLDHRQYRLAYIFYINLLPDCYWSR